MELVAQELVELVVAVAVAEEEIASEERPFVVAGVGEVVVVDDEEVEHFQGSPYS